MYEPTVGYAMSVMGLLGAFALYERTSPDRHLQAAVGFLAGVGLIGIVIMLLGVIDWATAW